MKKTLTLTLGAALLAGASFAQNVAVAESHILMVNKVTASWCGPCGAGGWDMFNSMIDAAHDAETPVIFMGTYASESTSWGNDGFFSDISKGMSNEWGTTGFPTFYLNGVVHSSGDAGMMSAVNDAIAEAPVVQAGFFTEVKNEKMTIHTAVEFFEDTEGDYNLAVYVIEDKVKGPQNGQTDQTGETEHHYVLRTEVSNETFGTALKSGVIKAGKLKAKQYTLDLDPSWDLEHIKIATVIWKNEGGTWEYVNGNNVPSPASFEAPVGIEEVADQTTMSVYPNPAADQFTLEMNNTKAGQYSIDIYNQLGQNVKSMYIGEVPAGTDRITNVNTSELSNGMYYVKVSNGTEVEALRMNIAR